MARPTAWRHVRAALAATLIVTGCAWMAACRQDQPETLVHEGQAMGTTLRVQVVGRFDEQQHEQLSATIAGVLAEVDERMSTWRDDSEIQALNLAETAEPMPVSPELFEILELAAEVSRASDGAFDVTVGPLVDAWGFGPRGESERRPDDAMLADLRQRTGWQLLQLDAERLAVRKADPRVRCDLSGIAKGHGVDRIARALESLGHSRYLVDLGGEMRASGAGPGGHAWRIAIERPDAGGDITDHVLPLRGSIATSGDYRKYLLREGRRIAHVLDPRTGRPIAHHAASVTVLHERCALADAWATAMLVMGDEDGMRVATEQGLAALFLVRTGEGFASRQSPAWTEATARTP